MDGSALTTRELEATEGLWTKRFPALLAAPAEDAVNRWLAEQAGNIKVYDIRRGRRHGTACIEVVYQQQ